VPGTPARELGHVGPPPARGRVDVAAWQWRRFGHGRSSQVGGLQAGLFGRPIACRPRWSEAAMVRGARSRDAAIAEPPGE
jgi:hypothetical protein